MFRNYDVEFEKLFWEKRFYVEAIARRYVSDSAVDDLTQKIFLKIYLKMGKILKAENQKGYIAKIAANEAINFLRTRKEDISIPREFEDLLFSTGEDAERSYLHNEMAEEFVKIAGSMAEKRRNVLLLRVMEEMSFREISDSLTISEESARNIFSVGIREVRKRLKKRLGGRNG